jgi:hypothetical protein
MPVYFAGWVNSNGTVRFGGNFTVTRNAPAGAFRITVSTTLTVRFLATVVTPVDLDKIARVAVFSQNGVTNTSNIDMEIRDRVSGALVDGAFNFIAMERSGS